MLYELSKSDFARVQTLFRALAYQPFCTAVLAGLHPGRVYVDDIENPQTACVIRDDSWCFLAGTPNNVAFNQALHTAIWDRTIIDEDAAMLLFTCEPTTWHAQMADIFAPRKPVSMPRRHYLCRELTYHNWRNNLPEGFSVQPMDSKLTQRFDLTISDEVLQTLDKWRDIDDSRMQDFEPKLRDFGFVAIDENRKEGPQVVSWATVDAIVDGTGDVGLFTLEGYRRRGLAAITTAATVEHGLVNGMDEVSWTCAEHNLGSIRTAEKLGFVQQRDYFVYFLGLNERVYLINWAWNNLETEQYEETLDAYEQYSASQDETPYYIHFPTACAHAALGNTEQAFEHLNLAIDKGFDDLKDMQQQKALDNLRNLPEWKGAVRRLYKKEKII